MNDRLPCDAKTLRAWMVSYIGSVLDLPPGGPPTGETFDTYGFDSVEAVVMAGVMEEEFSVPVDPVLFFENPSIDQFVAACASASGTVAPDSPLA
jgi:acyl carrier protein